MLLGKKEAKKAAEHLISSEDVGDAPQEVQDLYFRGIKAGIQSALGWQKKYGWYLIRFIPEPTFAWVEKNG